MLHKPFYERGLGAILPRCDGPFKIAATPTAHSAVLVDPLTNEPIDNGKLVSIARLIRFDYPADSVTMDVTEVPSRKDTIQNLKVGEYVAVELAKSRVNVARVMKTFREQGQAEVMVLEIATTDRFGPWTRRKWTTQNITPGVPRIEVVTEAEVLCTVELRNDALTEQSVVRLATLGIASGATPSRDKSIAKSR